MRMTRSDVESSALPLTEFLVVQFGEIFEKLSRLAMVLDPAPYEFLERPGHIHLPIFSLFTYDQIERDMLLAFGNTAAPWFSASSLSNSQASTDSALRMQDLGELRA